MEEKTTMEITNDALEEAIKEYAGDRTKDSLTKVLNLLGPTRLLVPAMLRENNQPTPCFLKSGSGEQYLAVYTSKAQIPEKPKSQAILNMPFPACNSIVVKEELALTGMVVNPFSDNLVLKKELVEKLHEMDEKRAKTKSVKMTPQQFQAFARRQVEFGVLPKRLFTEGESFVDELCERKEAFVNEIYKKTFKEEKLYPFSEQDFSVMALNISEDLLLVQIDLPVQNLVPPLCYRVYITMNPQNKKVDYFTIEMTPEKDVRKLGRMGADGKHIDCGEAPVEGAELQKIMDLARFQEEMTS